MKKDTLKVLVLNDDDLDCKKSDEERSINDITLEVVGLSALILKNWPIIVYEGKLGTKILKSNLFKGGIVV